MSPMHRAFFPAEQGSLVVPTKVSIDLTLLSATELVALYCALPNRRAFKSADSAIEDRLVFLVGREEADRLCFAHCAQLLK